MRSVFWGWNTIINVRDMATIKDIEHELKLRLNNWIMTVENMTQQRDLHGLKQAANTLKMHFHNMTMKDITNYQGIIYVCHCDHAQ
jgi:hypothetical protein